MERRGTDGDLQRFSRELAAADGRVDCLCVGGANLALHWRGRKYPIRCIVRAAASVRQTPLVDGFGVKDSLERQVAHFLVDEGVIDLEKTRVLFPCVVDRFGIADELRSMGLQNAVCGDLMFNLGLAIPLLGFRPVDILAPTCLPILVRLPFSWLYPIGSKQDEIKPRWHRWWKWADVIIGDFLVIRRHMPDDLSGKIIVTNSTTQQDRDLLRKRRAAAIITTSLRADGRTFGTNVLDGILVTLAGKPPDQMTRDDYISLAQQIGWSPQLTQL